MHQADWWNLLLRRAWFFQRLSHAKQRQLLDNCFSFVEKKVAMLIARAGAPACADDVVRAAGIFGAKVSCPSRHIAPNFLAEYDADRREIFCYRENITAIEKEKAAAGPFFQKHSLLTMCMLHELFHHLEYSFGRVPSICAINCSPIPFLPLRYCPEAMSEVAAHAFVQRVLALEINPYWITALTEL